MRESCGERFASKSNAGQRLERRLMKRLNVHEQNSRSLHTWSVSEQASSQDIYERIFERLNRTERYIETGLFSVNGSYHITPRQSLELNAMFNHFVSREPIVDFFRHRLRLFDQLKWPTVNQFNLYRFIPNVWDKGMTADPNRGPPCSTSILSIAQSQQQGGVQFKVCQFIQSISTKWCRMIAGYASLQRHFVRFLSPSAEVLYV